jgi:hypothetical protein
MAFGGGSFGQGPFSSIAIPRTTFDDVRQAIIDGLVSAQSEANGWNATRSSIPVTAVVRTSDTVATITLPAIGTYDITANETVTSTVPASTTGSGSSIVAAPTFSIAAFGVAGARALIRTVLQAINRASYF